MKYSSEGCGGDRGGENEVKKQTAFQKSKNSFKDFFLEGV